MNNGPMTEALRPLLTGNSALVSEREVLRVAALLIQGEETDCAGRARKEVIKWLQNRTAGQLPDSASKGQSFEHLAGGRVCSGIRLLDESSDIWAVRADDPDKTTPRRVWTTEVTIGQIPGQGVRFGLRLLVCSPERELEIEPAVPGFVLQIAGHCKLYRGEIGLIADPWVISSDQDAQDLISLLVDPQREIPVFVLTVPEISTDLGRPLLDPVPLGRTTIGLARVVVLPARFTWVLTQRFGKKLSVFNGAVRAYLPGFSESSNPYGGHELYLAERFTSLEDAARVTARMQRLAAHESLRRVRLGRDVVTFAAVREVSLDRERGRLERQGASSSERLRAADAQLMALKDDLKKANEDQQWLFDVHKEAEERAEHAEEQLRAAGFRIQQLTAQLRERGGSLDANIPLPDSWNTFADWCEEHLIGRVALTPRARREVKDPQFRDVATAARCLLWLASDYREGRVSGGNGDFRTSLGSGIKNERCGADAFRMDWQGRRIDVQWHVKNGGNTRNPGFCLRIYYFWDDQSQQVVIASMPAHIPTGAT